MPVSFKVPTYNLDSIKTALSSVEKLTMTNIARGCASAMGMDDQDVVDVIQRLKPENFYKTMPSDKCPHLQQFDVYHGDWKGTDIYLKFQFFNGFLVVSFKEK